MATLNPFLNLQTKVKALLKVDDTLTKDQCEMFQWQLLAKVPGCDFSFIIGKGGVNTIFFTPASGKRDVVYPDEALELLASLCKQKVFCYAVYDKRKEVVGYFLNEADAKGADGAKYVRSVSFSGKSSLIWKREKNLFGKMEWVAKKASA